MNMPCPAQQYAEDLDAHLHEEENEQRRQEAIDKATEASLKTLELIDFDMALHATEAGDYFTAEIKGTAKPRTAEWALWALWQRFKAYQESKTDQAARDVADLLTDLIYLNHRPNVELEYETGTPLPAFLDRQAD